MDSRKAMARKKREHTQRLKHRHGKGPHPSRQTHPKPSKEAEKSVKNETALRPSDDDERNEVSGEDISDNDDFVGDVDDNHDVSDLAGFDELLTMNEEDSYRLRQKEEGETYALSGDEALSLENTLLRAALSARLHVTDPYLSAVIDRVPEVGNGLKEVSASGEESLPAVDGIPTIVAKQSSRVVQQDEHDMVLDELLLLPVATSPTKPVVSRIATQACSATDQEPSSDVSQQAPQDGEEIDDWLESLLG